MSNKSTPIVFRRETRLSKMLKRNESGELTETEVPLEFRFDPLTGHSCRIVQFTLERIIRPDLEELEKRSRELTCPFCPPLVEQITPSELTGLLAEALNDFLGMHGLRGIHAYESHRFVPLHTSRRAGNRNIHGVAVHMTHHHGPGHP